MYGNEYSNTYISIAYRIRAKLVYFIANADKVEPA